MQDLYSENYKTLIKNQVRLNKRRNILCLWIGSFNIKIFPKLIYRFNAIASKIPARFFLCEKSSKFYNVYKN